MMYIGSILVSSTPTEVLFKNKYLQVWFTTYSIPQTKKFVTSGIRDLHRWDIKSAGPVVEKSIRKTALYEISFVVVNLMVAVLGAAAHAIPGKNDKDFFLALVVFERFFPTFETPLTFLYRISYFASTLVILAPFHMTIYFSGHLRAQISMLVTCLQNLNYGYDKMDLLKSVYDVKYQKEISRRLKFCIERHIRIYS